MTVMELRNEHDLTRKEHDLLKALVKANGEILSRADLLIDVWDVAENFAERMETRTVDMTLARVRKKLGDRGEWIETVRGFGYRFVSDEVTV